jgi:hypothetical protein
MIRNSFFVLIAWMVTAGVFSATVAAMNLGLGGNAGAIA